LRIVKDGLGLFAVFFAVENFWIYALQLPGPKEWREVEVLSEMVERNVITDSDAGRVGLS
jgi:hypothetical protein